MNVSANVTILISVRECVISKKSLYLYESPLFIDCNCMQEIRIRICIYSGQQEENHTKRRYTIKNILHFYNREVKRKIPLSMQ